MEEQTIQQSPVKKDRLLPASIIIAALLVSGALVYNVGKTEERKQPVIAPAPSAAVPENMRAVSAEDHIFGSAQAPVKIVMFSDLECPYCKEFHTTAKRIANEYGEKVALVFRPFPLPMHSKAKQEAVASECAAKLGGSDAFWKYVDRVFAITPSNNGLDLAELPRVARYVGVDVTKFNACLASGEFDTKIAAYLTDGKNAGVEGTPYSVAIAPNGQMLAINGAQSYEYVKTVVDEMLKMGK